MKVSKAAKIWIDYHKTHSKKNTVRSYQSVIDRFCQDFGDCEIDQVTPDEVLSIFGFLSEASKFSIRKDSIQINQSYMLIRWTST